MANKDKPKEIVFLPSDPFGAKKTPGFAEYLATLPEKKEPIAVIPGTPGKFNPYSPKQDPALTQYLTTMGESKTPATPRAASIVPKQSQSPQPTVQQTPQAEEGNWLSRIFQSEKTEPGEYSTARNLGMGAVQFLGNFGNSISGNAALNPSLNQAFAQKRQEYMDMDPNSRSSVLYRGMAQRMGLPIRGDETAFTLKEQMPNVREFLMARQMEGRGGSGVPQVKNQQQALKDINDHLTALQDLSAMGTNIKKLNRSAVGNLLPDVSPDTIANAAEIQKQVQSGVKAIAGPGSIQESEREAFMPLLPNANERSEVAIAKQQKSMQTAIDKGKAYIKNQLNLGTINEETARYLMGEYAKYDAQLNRGKK